MSADSDADLQEETFLRRAISDVAANVQITHRHCLREEMRARRMQTRAHRHSFRLIWWMRWDRWDYLGWVSTQRIALAFQVHLFFMGKVVITCVYCQPESSRAARICTRPRLLHPAFMSCTFITSTWHRHTYLNCVSGLLLLARNAKTYAMMLLFQFLYILCSSSTKRQRRLFRASGLWFKPTSGTRRSLRRPSCSCKPKEQQITNPASRLPLSSFSM